MESHHPLIVPEGKLLRLSKSQDSVWWMYLSGCMWSHMAVKLTVKRGVSFLMSSRDTSIPITPRINWFWCWEKVWEKSMRKNSYSSGPATAYPTHHVFKHLFTAPRHSCHLWSLFYWRQAVFQWWPDPVPDGELSKHIIQLRNLMMLQ